MITYLSGHRVPHFNYYFMRKMLKYFPCFLLLILFACNNNKKPSEAGDVEALFADYKISGEEGYNQLTVLARFYPGDNSDESVLLNPPAKLELDGELFPVDSATMTGAFYELNKPVTGFSGKHTITYTGVNSRPYQEEFNFEPLILRTEIPAVMRRGDIYFDLSGVEPGDRVRILMTDTSFVNEGISRLDTVNNGRLKISAEALKNLANGPIQLELVKEIDRPVKNGTIKGGRLRILYRLRRSFTLENQEN